MAWREKTFHFITGHFRLLALVWLLVVFVVNVVAVNVLLTRLPPRNPDIEEIKNNSTEKLFRVRSNELICLLSIQPSPRHLQQNTVSCVGVEEWKKKFELKSGQKEKN